MCCVSLCVALFMWLCAHGCVCFFTVHCACDGCSLGTVLFVVRVLRVLRCGVVCLCVVCLASLA